MAPRPPLTIIKCPNVILLLHGFNSSRGNKAEEIKEFLFENNLEKEYELIAPQLDYEPRRAIREINKIIRTNKHRKVYLIGTSLGGFYANYFRAKFSDKFLYVHSINPSWKPSQSLYPYKNQVLQNFKTEERWEFKESYISQFEEFENFIKSKLYSPLEKNYCIHLSKSDDVLKFDDMLHFLQKQKIAFIKKEYDSDHRFRKIKKVMELVIKV
ncbi:hypothetical protein HN928_02810 [bacterium]|jgi:uncharacterized protein|nr:hypothetical protein [bacterium]